MKLLTKTTLYISTLSLFLFFLMGIIFFQVLKSMSINELNREMKETRKILEKELPAMLEHNIRDLPGYDSLIIKKVDKMPGNLKEFRDTILFDALSKQYRTYRIHSFLITDSTHQYRVSLIKSTTPTDKLVERVTLMMTIMVILFLSGLFILNRYIFANLWRDFFTALDKLKEFNTEEGSILFQESDIHEFNELNTVLEKMTRRLSKDYLALKEYTDNTTHELQTPLAIIKSKTELLLQSDNLRQKDIELIRDIYKNADHLSRLNSTLALITRIENQQFAEKSDINFNSLIERHLDMLKELIELKNLEVRKNLPRQPALVMMDQGLADILIINLLKNAISHNIDKGMIEIDLSADKLIISNSGEEITPDPEKYFDRFYRGAGKSDSFGLGLPLIKKICEYYEFIIEYHVEEKIHTLTLKFHS